MTFGEIIYAVLDRLKALSDDSYYTEEHVIFLAKKMRAFLLDRKYKGGRNQTFQQMSPENRQQICLSLETAQMLPNGCGGQWLKSTAEMPQLLVEGDAVTCTGHDLLPTNVTFITYKRMPYVGYNKWLKNIIYACRSMDGHLYLHGSNPQFMYLERVGLTGVFADPEEAAKLSHEACENGSCDLLNTVFPLESALVPSCIELVVQELAGPLYAPEDKNNNANDNLSGLAAAKGSGMAARPAEVITSAPAQE